MKQANVFMLVTAVFCVVGVFIGQCQKAVAQQPKGMQWVLRQMDQDDDGAISRSEAKGRMLANFDRVDQDSSGLIDKGELSQLFKRLREARGQGASEGSSSVPDDVELRENVAYRDGNEKWKLDLVLPKNREDELSPVVVFIHGGGWRNGDKSSGVFRDYPLEYASHGYVCASINYRLVDECTILDCIADCKCAVRWLRAHAEEFAIDVDNFGAYGNSAGAHLVAMLGLSATHDELEGDGPYREYSCSVQAVCSSATPTKFRLWGEEVRSGGGRAAALFGVDNTEKAMELASPVTYVTSTSPPFLMVHGTADTTVPVQQSDDLNKLFQEHESQDVTYLRIDGAGHGVFRQHASETVPAMREFFDRVLRGNSE
ncbi:MAG: alpha/beta hydrolase [Planctomycetaceae bacterium]|nr:alpha/beta hydrolase [Planctomycetaceae bacterium]MBT6919974.1 alpha/beta hydrolase [Planctomycetaceae bacterium]